MVSIVMKLLRKCLLIMLKVKNKSFIKIYIYLSLDAIKRNSGKSQLVPSQRCEIPSVLKN